MAASVATCRSGECGSFNGLLHGFWNIISSRGVQTDKPWAGLMPLEADRTRRQPGLLRGELPLPAIEMLLAPLQIPQPIPQPRSAPRHPTQMKFCRCYGPTATAWGRPSFRSRLGQSASTRQWSISVSCSSSRAHSAEAFLQGLRPCLEQRG